MAGHALGPLFFDGFMKELPSDVVEALVPKWESIRKQCHSQSALLGVDLVLRAAAFRLAHQKEWTADDARITQNPSSARLLPREKLDRYFDEWRQTVVSGLGMRPGA